MRQQVMRYFFIAWFWAILGQIFYPISAQAQVSNDYNYILSDRDLLDYSTMDLKRIQAFLVSKQSPLTNYIEPITALTAAQIIYQSARDFQLNPQFLLALIQKEQSLIEDSSPQPEQFDWATGYAVCDSCNTNDPGLQKFKGFYNQVYNAAKRIRTVYLAELANAGVTSSGFGPGLSKLVDGQLVTPANLATAVAYTYTPHLHGNMLFKQIWRRFFAQVYPDGALLRAEGSQDIWLIQDGYRRMFASPTVYLSRYANMDKVLTVSLSELEKYPAGPVIKLANYSYLRTPRGTVYLLIDDRIRGFASAEALRKIGINPEEIIDVSTEDIADYQEDKPITVDSIYPLGALLQDKQTGGVYWVQDGIKRPIYSKEIMLANFPNRKIIQTSPAELRSFKTGAPVLFREGELVKAEADPAVYIISHGQRRPFLSENDFLSLGFKWSSVVVTSTAALAQHELGEPVTVNF